MLHSATDNTEHYYGNDVKTAAQLLNHVLMYESQQTGFDLTATRDAEFNEVRADTTGTQWSSFFRNWLCCKWCRNVNANVGIK